MSGLLISNDSQTFQAYSILLDIEILHEILMSHWVPKQFVLWLFRAPQFQVGGYGMNREYFYETSYAELFLLISFCYTSEAIQIADWL